MKCEKCGSEINKIRTSMFFCDGSDHYVELPIREVGDGVFCFETDMHWTGYELEEEEMAESIMCPVCGGFPFKIEEVHTMDIVEVVCFNK